MDEQNAITEEMGKLDVWDRADIAIHEVVKLLMEVDTSNMTTMELIKLTRPIYGEALAKME